MAMPYPPNQRRSEQHKELSNPENDRIDPSAALFSMYLERSDEDDKKTAERWKAESDVMLIFAGLFSAAIASLLSVSIQDLRSDPQETSAFYLANIYHIFANTTTSQPIILPIPADPPEFSPSKGAVWVNSLWFLSLVMTLTGALLAVFVQQWAQTYLQATQERATPLNRAQIRTYYSEGIEKWHLPWVTRRVSTLIHVSLILFFSGLPVFLFIINRTVFNIIATWMALCVLGYACITLIPILSQDSPYYSPLSSLTWLCVTRTLKLVLKLLESFVPHSSIFRWYNAYYTNSQLGFPSSQSRDRRQVSRDAVLDPTGRLESGIGYRALKWMFETLNRDDEFEQFFDALPGLSASKVYVDHQDNFVNPNERQLSAALIGLMNRTLSSSLVSEGVKQRRIIICTRALHAASFIQPWQILTRVLGDWRRFLGCIEFGLFVQNWNDITLPFMKIYAQCVVASILQVSSVQKREDSWFQLASGHLMMSKSLLQNHYARGDSILLTNVIDIIRRTFESYSESEGSDRSVILDGCTKTLELVCKLDIRDTRPELQHEFCTVWNQLIDANTFPHVEPISMMMLKSTRRLYIALHNDTPSPVAFSSITDDGDSVLDHATSYPKCRIDLHPYRAVSNLRLVGPLPNTSGDSRSHSSASAIISTSSISSVFASALSSLHTTTTHHNLTSATAPSSISSTDYIPQMTRACGGDVPPAMAEPAAQQDLDISRSSSRFTPGASQRGSAEEMPPSSPSFRSALSVSSGPWDDISIHSDLREVRIHSPQTG